MECWIFTFPYKKYLWGHFYPIVINRQQKPTLKPFEQPVRFTTGTIRKCYKLNLPGLSMGMAQKLHNSTLQVTTRVTSTHLWSCKMVYNGYWTLSCWKMRLKSTLWFGYEIDSFGLKSNTNRDQTSISSTGEVSIKTNKDDLLI
jgi:hypothetical protein